MAPSAAKTRLYEQIAVSGKALSHASRLELLDLLSQGERSVDSLARAAELNLTTASAHLQVLKQAGLVHTRRDGVKVYYRLAGDDVAHLFALLRTVADRHRPDAAAARIAYLGPSSDPTMAPDQLRDRLNDGGLVVLDVRPAEEYQAGHIPGAVSIPIDELATRISELPADAEIVVYCRGHYCAFAHQAVTALKTADRRAIRLHDGMLEWRLAGNPVTVARSA